MAKTSQSAKSRITLIIIALLLICGIAAFIAFLSLTGDDTPSKAVYVFKNTISY